jgi:hypothetical protein
MSSFRPRRTAAVALLAVTASSGVALVATDPAAGSVTPRAHTSLSIRVAKPAIQPGGTDRVMGDLAASDHHVAGRVILLQAKPAGTTSWVGEARHRTGRLGRVGFRVSPPSTTRYRLVFRGNGLQRPSVSGVVAVRVLAPRSTSLTISQDTIYIEPGGSDGIHGVLSHDGAPLAGEAVALRSRTNSQLHFHLASTATTATDGTVSFTVSPAVTTHYVLVHHKTTTTEYARSPIATVHVRRPSSLSIRARAGTNREVISGQLRGGGHALRNRPVTLEASPHVDGTPDTWTAVGTARTNKHGIVVFKVAKPTASEDYKLVFAGGWNFDPCESAVATVTVS